MTAKVQMSKSDVKLDFKEKTNEHCQKVIFQCHHNALDNKNPGNNEGVTPL